eukprot:482802_1
MYFLCYLCSLCSFFFLIQSETIIDVVLNAFALTFIIELDDMANIFESDEDYVILADMKKWYSFMDTKWPDKPYDGKQFPINPRRTNITINMKDVGEALGLCIMSPFYVLIATKNALLCCYNYLIKDVYKQNKDGVVTPVELTKKPKASQQNDEQKEEEDEEEEDEQEDEQEDRTKLIQQTKR